MRERVALGVVALGIAMGGCATEGERPQVQAETETVEGVTTEWERLDEIVYLLPEELPEGWSVHVATERPGRPRSEWTDHFEVLGDASGDRFLVLGSTLGADASTESQPGPIEDLPVDDFVYFFIYVVGVDPSSMAARGVAWGDNDVAMSVAQIGSTPDDRLTERVADGLARDARFDFAVPTPAIDAGFAPLGSAAGSTEDVADYTVSWGPAELAGKDRAAAADAPDDGPTISINVGARFYGQMGDGRSGDAATVPIRRDGDLLQLQLLISGAPLSVSGRGVTEEQLRAFAVSLVELDRDAWRRELGERLLVDEPDS